MNPNRLFHDQSGAALLLALLVLSLLSLIGLFMSINATTGVQISDNYESHVQATYAALAGLNHAKVLLCGLGLNDLLRGPDGIYSANAAYRAEARSYRYRLPLPLSTALILDISDPLPGVSGIPDDGMFSTGVYNNIPGTMLIPVAGISMAAPDPPGMGVIPTSRYFVKVSDNNGEVSEMAGDANDDPFTDGDRVILVRSMGIARTTSRAGASAGRRNSVVVFEARLKRLSTWTLGAALIVVGNQLQPDLGGSFEIDGGDSPGIATIDPVPEDEVFPDQILRAAASGSGEISGGREPTPSISDISAQIRRNRDHRLLLDPDYLLDFVRNQSPRIADSYFDGNQDWTAGNAPYFGAYNPALPLNAPDQDPKITVVNGDLQVAGNVSGGGLLIVTGRFSCQGSFVYDGLILAIGAGDLNIAGANCEIRGGLYAANMTETAGETSFGSPRIAIGGKSRIVSNRNAVEMAVGLIPPSQISFREIAGTDP